MPKGCKELTIAELEAQHIDSRRFLASLQAYDVSVYAVGAVSWWMQRGKWPEIERRGRQRMVEALERRKDIHRRRIAQIERSIEQMQ